MELDRMASGQVLLALAIAGVSAHLLYWIHGEKSMKAVHAWLWSHVALNAALSLVAIRSGTLGAWQSLAWLSLLNVSFYMPLFTSIVVYRVFFHRLRTFPGPTALSISKLAAAYANVAKNQDARRIWALHKRYGNIVRIGPRELSVLDADAAPLLYGPSSRCTRAPWYDRIKSTTGHESQEFQIFQLRDPAQHAARRKAVWDKAFNIGALKDFEPLVHDTCNAFVAAVGKHAGESLSGPEVLRLLGYDLMGAVGWGKTFSNIQNWKLNPVLEFVQKLTEPQQILSQAPWLLNLLANLPGGDKAIYRYGEFVKDQVDRRRRQETRGNDAMSKIISSQQNLSAKTLYDEGELMVIAGGDTISTTLASITFHLARNPQILRKLQAELDAVDGVSTGAFEYRSISRLPYLEAVINETLRIQPPVQGGIYRVTPPEGLRFPDGTFIPGDTIISIPNLPIQRDARYFVDPEDFIPERWTSEPEKTINKAAFSPFSQGPYMCVGRGLAYIEMKTAIALLFSRFDVRLADGEDGRKFFEETKDCQVTHLGDFQIVFSKR